MPEERVLVTAPPEEVASFVWACQTEAGCFRDSVWCVECGGVESDSTYSRISPVSEPDGSRLECHRYLPGPGYTGLVGGPLPSEGGRICGAVTIVPAAEVDRRRRLIADAEETERVPTWSKYTGRFFEVFAYGTKVVSSLRPEVAGEVVRYHRKCSHGHSINGIVRVRYAVPKSKLYPDGWQVLDTGAVTLTAV